MKDMKTVSVNGRTYAWPKQPLVVVCIDGSQPEYMEEAVAGGHMPFTKEMLDCGADLRGDCVVPSFTNPNNLSIVTGVPPKVHGISGNFFLDPETGEEVMMNDPKLLRTGTIFQAFHNAGAKIAIVTAKDKLRRTSTLTFGVIGLGRIGTAAALRAKALGFRVMFYDPHLPNGVHKAVGIERVDSLAKLLKQSDVVSIHCPLNDQTHYLIAEPELTQMKPTAYLVNTARGGIVKKKAVLAALKKGTIAGAGLDVIEDEPLKTQTEASTPNLIATCHAAFCSREGMIEMRTTSARIAKQAIQGKRLDNVVNGVS